MKEEPSCLKPETKKLNFLSFIIISFTFPLLFLSFVRPFVQCIKKKKKFLHTCTHRYTRIQWIKSKRININSEEARRIIARITESAISPGQYAVSIFDKWLKQLSLNFCQTLFEPFELPRRKGIRSDINNKISIGKVSLSLFLNRNEETLNLSINDPVSVKPVNRLIHFYSNARFFPHFTSKSRLEILEECFISSRSN